MDGEGGGRLNTDTSGQRGGQKLAKSCGRLLWMTPNVYCILLDYHTICAKQLIPFIASHIH